MGVVDFFSEYPVFRHDEIVDYLKYHNEYNSNTLKALLNYHLKQKNISRIRRGYYIVINPLLNRYHIGNDSLLIAGRMTKDAVISYHSAIEFHALPYSIYHIVYFCTTKPKGIIVTPHGHYQQIGHPTALKPNDIFLETKIHDRQGLDIRVTTVERTLVDSLDKPQFSGGWEEIWRSFESISFLDIDRTINYALRLGNATTIAKLGFFMEQHQEQFSVQEEHLRRLEQNKPKSKHYMQHSEKEPVKYFKRWNLIVPISVVNKNWEEPHNDNI